MSTLWLMLGLVILTLGADVLVRSASALALAMRITPLVVGLTIVAFGTSAPELVVSVQSALSGQGDIALGNAVGSNIFNVLFILGLSAVVAPLIVAPQLVRFDVPLMIFVSLLVYALGWDGAISRSDGAVLVAGLVSYTLFAIHRGRSQHSVTNSSVPAAGSSNPTAGAIGRNVVLTVVGLGMLVLGSRLFVSGAVEIARGLGVSELVIGLTLVAAGTSLPEVATSVMAAWRGERDIAVGNVVGSNIFNILCVLGMAGMASPQGVPVSAAAMGFDLPVMVLVALACLPVFYLRRQLGRWEGGMFLGYYVAYIVALVAFSTQPAWTGTYAQAMQWVAAPLTIVLLAMSALRERRLQSAAPVSSPEPSPPTD